MHFVRSLALFAVLLLLLLAACVPDPIPPDMRSREAFAKSVVTTAATGSVEEVEKLAGNGSKITPSDAQKLVEFARTWNDATGMINFINVFPEVANVEASTDSPPASIKYTISWNRDHWSLYSLTPRPPTREPSP